MKVQLMNKRENIMTKGEIAKRGCQKLSAANESASVCGEEMILSHIYFYSYINTYDMKTNHE